MKKSPGDTPKLSIGTAGGLPPKNKGLLAPGEVLGET